MSHPRVTERQLQGAVEACARALGWRLFHPWSAVHSAAGFPDLTMTRGGRLVFAELKTATGTLSSHQAEWLAELRLVPGVEVHVFRPADWFDGTIERVLRGE